MKSIELLDEVKAFVEQCQSRIVGIGAEQYARGDTQKFETMDLDHLFEYVDEEVRDLVNYAVMVHIRMERLRLAASIVEVRVKSDTGRFKTGIDPQEDGIL